MALKVIRLYLNMMWYVIRTQGNFFKKGNGLASSIKSENKCAKGIESFGV